MYIRKDYRCHVDNVLQLRDLSTPDAHDLQICCCLVQVDDCTYSVSYIFSQGQPGDLAFPDGSKAGQQLVWSFVDCPSEPAPTALTTASETVAIVDHIQRHSIESLVMADASPQQQSADISQADEPTLTPRDTTTLIVPAPAHALEGVITDSDAVTTAESVDSRALQLSGQPADPHVRVKVSAVPSRRVLLQNTASAPVTQGRGLGFGLGVGLGLRFGL